MGPKSDFSSLVKNQYMEPKCFLYEVTGAHRLKTDLNDLFEKIGLMFLGQKEAKMTQNEVFQVFAKNQFMHISEFFHEVTLA